jgi:DnaJ-class molecular chaperone
MNANPYDTLGVAKTATPDDIKNAYRNLAKKFHPDLNPGNKRAEAKFKEINAAYELLGTPEMKAKYDSGEIDNQGQQAHAQQGPSRGAERGPYYNETQQQGGGGRYSFYGNSDNDFYDSIFGNLRNQRAANVAPEDITYLMEVEFPDSIVGNQKEISLPNGKKLQVKIPAGIESGTKMRFRGQGTPAEGTAPAGDLYIQVQVKPSRSFRRVGKDVEVEIPVSINEAVLGGEIKVPTVSGSVMLKIPAGVSSGAKLRVRGKGVAGKTPQESGDQIVALKVVLPEKVDPELELAMRTWSEKHAYDPRAQLKFD